MKNELHPGPAGDPKPGSVYIPQSPLAQKIAETEALKREMAEMLRQLEEQVVGERVSKPGGWRHNTADWARKHPAAGPKRLT